jgi:hypothetical protein
MTLNGAIVATGVVGLALVVQGQDGADEDVRPVGGRCRSGRLGLVGRELAAGLDLGQLAQVGDRDLDGDGDVDGDGGLGGQAAGRGGDGRLPGADRRHDVAVDRGDS